MAVTLLAGAETSIQNTDNNPRDMDAPVHLLEPDAAPLTALMRMIGTKPATNPKVEWQENEAMPRLTTLSASAASNATAFGVSADIFRVGDVLLFPTQGFGALVSATAAGAITAAKIGGDAQASAQSGSEVFIVSNANAEGATLREIKFPQLVTASNYCQIIRTPVGLTETEQATNHYGGDEEARLIREAGIEHARATDQTFWFGSRDISSVTRQSGGIIKEFIATNVTADTGGLTETEWQTFLKSAFRYGSERKTAFCSPAGLAAIEGFARSNIRVNDDVAKTYGIQMKTYVSGQGVVDLVLNRYWNDSSVFGGYVCVVDMDAVKERPLRTTRLKRNVQAPDYDGRKHEYITETTIQVIHERRHALLTGIT